MSSDLLELSGAIKIYLIPKETKVFNIIDV